MYVINKLVCTSSVVVEEQEVSTFPTAPSPQTMILKASRYMGVNGRQFCFSEVHKYLGRKGGKPCIVVCIGFRFDTKYSKTRRNCIQRVQRACSRSQDTLIEKDDTFSFA